MSAPFPVAFNPPMSTAFVLRALHVDASGVAALLGGEGGGCAGFRGFGTYSAQPPVDARSEPDTTGYTKDRPLTV
jgi:hypothetical protein